MQKFRDEDFKTPGMCDPETQHKCVAVAIKPDAVYVRDSKDAAKTTLCFTYAEWRAFILDVKKGAFDLTQPYIMPMGGRRHQMVGPTLCECGATIPPGEDYCPIGQVQV
jgi:hypothetical protein